MLRRAKRLTQVVREAWLVNRVPRDERIFHALHQCLHSRQGSKIGLRRYLKDRAALCRHDITRDWYHDVSTNEMRLDYGATLFAPGRLRVLPCVNTQGALIFLPGHQMCADEVLSENPRPKSLVSLARDLNLSLICWDWPLQGQRLDRCLFRGLRSVYSAEREYTRILPAIGTSLWREYVAELEWALSHIARLLPPALPIHVVGWSMGGAFAYLAPLLGTPLASTIAMGSCARIRDLVAEGETRRHGFFFYPMDAVAYFDLDDVVEEVLGAGHHLDIICGDGDKGCLEATMRQLTDVAQHKSGRLVIEVLPQHGHTFSRDIRERLAALLGERSQTAATVHPQVTGLEIS